MNNESRGINFTGTSELKSNISKKVVMDIEDKNGIQLIDVYAPTNDNKYALVLSRAEVRQDLSELKGLTSRQKSIVEGNVLEKIVSSVFGTRQGKLKRRIDSAQEDLVTLEFFVGKYEDVRKNMTDQYFEKMAQKEVDGVRIYGYDQTIETLRDERKKIQEDVKENIAGNDLKSKLARINIERESEIINQDMEEIRQYQNACALRVCMVDKEISIYAFYKDKAGKILQMSKETLACGQRYLKYAQEHGGNLLTGSEILTANLRLDDSINNLKKEVDSLEVNIERQMDIVEKYDRKKRIDEVLPSPKQTKSGRYVGNRSSSWVDQAKLILERGSKSHQI